MKNARSWSIGFGVVGALAGFAGCGGLNDGAIQVVNDNQGGSTSGSSGSSGTGGTSGAGGAPSTDPDGGTAGGGGDTSQPALEVEEITPSGAETGVETDAGVRITFSEPLDPATVNADTVRLLDGDAVIAGRLSYADSVVTFQPERPLALLAEYTVRVTTGVVASSGNALERAYESRFTTRDGDWLPQQKVHYDDDYPLSLRVSAATDAKGDVLVVWSPSSKNTSDVDVYARWYRRGRGWEERFVVDQTDSFVLTPSIAMNDHGDAVVAWFEQDPVGNYRVWARRYLEGSWEEEAKRLDRSDLATSVSSLVTRVNATGQFFVAWNEYGDYDSVNVNAAAGSGAWQEYPKSFDSGGTDNYLGPLDLAVAPDGSATLVYTFRGTTEEVRYARFDAGTATWTFTEPVPGSGAVVGDPKVALAASGAAVAVWPARIPDESGTGADTYVFRGSRFTKEAGWPQQPSTLSAGTGSVFTGVNPVAARGEDFYAVYSQSIGTINNVYFVRYASDGGSWSLPELLSDGNVTAQAPEIALDQHGNAFAAWTKGSWPTNLVDINVARYSASSQSWSEPLSPVGETTDPFMNPRLVVSANGYAYAYWDNTDGHVGSQGVFGSLFE